MVTRTALVAAIGERYRAGTRIERSAILDAFVAVTGYHRKHAIRLLSVTEQAPPVPRGARRRYGDEVRDALIVLWEASDRLCSKRLKPLIPVLLPALEHHGRLVVGPELRERLLAVGPASMDRLLSEIRLVAHGGRRRCGGSSAAVRRSVPIRAFGDWNDPPPSFVEVGFVEVAFVEVAFVEVAFVEVDFVAHGGTTVAGSFVQTMVLTDIATGWTECLPVVVRSGELVIKALIAARCKCRMKIPQKCRTKIPHFSVWRSARFRHGRPLFWRPAAAFGSRRRDDGCVRAGVLGDEVGMGAQAVAGAFDLDDDGVVEEAIEQCRGDDRIAEDVAPAKARRPLPRSPEETRPAGRGRRRSRGWM